MNPTIPRTWNAAGYISLALVTILFLATLLPLPAAAQCSSLYTYAHVNAPGTYITGFTNLANMGGVALVGGKANPIVGVGTDSGNYPGYRPAPYTCPQYYWLKNLTPTDIIIAGATAQNPKWDTCPAYWTDKMTAAVWELVGEGTQSHGARFVAATTKFDSRTSRFNFSLPMQPANQKALLDVPAPLVTSVSEDPAGMVVSLSIPSPRTGSGMTFADNTAFAAQHYATGDPRPTVVAGWDVYALASSSTPLSGQAASWTALGTVALDLTPGSTVTPFQVTLPSDGVTPFYFSVAPRFTGDFRPHLGSQSAPRYFVGPNSVAVMPVGFSALISTAVLTQHFAPVNAGFAETAGEPLPEFVPRDLHLDGVPAETVGFLGGLAGSAHPRDNTWVVSWASTDETEVFYYEVVLSRPSGEILAVSDMILAAGEPSAYSTEVTAPEAPAGPVVATILVNRTDGSTTRSEGIRLLVPRACVSKGTSR